MSDSEGEVEEVEVKVIVQPEEIVSSGDDPPMSEWSSIIIEYPEQNMKKALYAKGLYSPGSGSICGKYITMSDSDIGRHPYYKYPPVEDPGIEDALFSPVKPIVYPDDGQDLYLAVCAEMDTFPVRKFHRSLLTDEINLKYYGVNPNAVRAMAMALKYNKTVRRLDLTDNFLNNDACYHLSEMLLINSNIREVILAGCRIGAQGILRLGRTLPFNRGLIKLDLSRCCLGEEGGMNFAQQIINGAGIAQVNLSYNELGRETALALTEAMEYRNYFTHLDLSWNNLFHSPSMVKMLSELSTSDVLQELNISWNSMESDRVAGQLKQILLIPTLRVLNMSNNRFSDAAVEIILENLIKAKKLVTLDLSFNPLSPQGVFDVLYKLTKPRLKLQYLNVDGICVENSFLSLLDKIKKMKSRKDFKITFGTVLHNWTAVGPDARKIILERADFLGKMDRKHKMDVGLFFLKVCKENPKPIPVTTLIDIKNFEGAPLDDDLVNEMANVFPGPKNAKYTMINLESICEYIGRLWPERQLPPTPPDTELEPPPKKAKNGNKK